MVLPQLEYRSSIVSSTLTRYTIFVASPSDVQAERNALRRIVDDANKIYFARLGIIAEVLGWEDVPSGIGLYPQDVINKYTEGKYDVFIGLMWSRFGTKTPNAESGTAEEFEDAYNTYLSSPDTLRVLFFFKEAPVDYSQIIAHQIEAVKNFKDKISIEKGVLYSTFKTRKEFTKLASNQLVEAILDLHRRAGLEPAGHTSSVSVDQTVATLASTKIELGLFDLIQLGTNSSNQMSESLLRIGSIIQASQERITPLAESFTQELGKEEKINYEKIILIFNEFAFTFDRMSDLLLVEVNFFHITSKDFYEHQCQLLLIISRMPIIDLSILLDIATQIRFTEEQLLEFRKSVDTCVVMLSSFPPCSTIVRDSTNRLVHCLNDLISALTVTFGYFSTIKSKIYSIVALNRS